MTQTQKDGQRVIGYASRSLSETDRRYSQTEKEALALVWACEKFHTYVYGISFALITDHKPLEVIQGRSKVDNWGGGGADIHIFVFCTINFFRNRLFLWCVNTYICISAPPNYRACYGPVIFGPKSKPCARIERWVLRMQPYKFKVKYAPGSRNIADSRSRLVRDHQIGSGYEEEAEYVRL